MHEDLEFFGSKNQLKIDQFLIYERGLMHSEFKRCKDINASEMKLSYDCLRIKSSVKD